MDLLHLDLVCSIPEGHFSLASGSEWPATNLNLWPEWAVEGELTKQVVCSFLSPEVEDLPSHSFLFDALPPSRHILSQYSPQRFLMCKIQSLLHRNLLQFHEHLTESLLSDSVGQQIHFHELKLNFSQLIFIQEGNVGVLHNLDVLGHVETSDMASRGMRKDLELGKYNNILLLLIWMLSWVSLLGRRHEKLVELSFGADEYEGPSPVFILALPAPFGVH